MVKPKTCIDCGRTYTQRHSVGKPTVRCPECQEANAKELRLAYNRRYHAEGRRARKCGRPRDDNNSLWGPVGGDDWRHDVLMARSRDTGRVEDRW